MSDKEKNLYKIVQRAKAGDQIALDYCALNVSELTAAPMGLGLGAQLALIAEIYKMLRRV